MKSFSLAVAITTACFLLTSCGPTDADKISDAQTCLNTATPASADSCVAMVAGITSQSAALIRCSGAFIKQGYGDPSKVANALSQINGGSGATQSIAMMTQLSFQYESTMAANVADAQTAQSDCNISESPGLIFLVGVAATATQAAQLAGSAPGSVNSADVTTGLGTIASGGNPAAAAVVGNAALSIYGTSCLNGNTTAGSFCTQFQSVIANAPGTDPTSVGTFLAQCYTAPATAGCQGFN